jgi:hypothetical protein
VSSGHRFAPPWSVEEHDGCFAVRDRNGQALSYVYFKDQRDWRTGAIVFTRDEAQHLAATVAKLPELIVTTDIATPWPDVRRAWLPISMTRWQRAREARQIGRG